MLIPLALGLTGGAYGAAKVRDALVGHPKTVEHHYYHMPEPGQTKGNPNDPLDTPQNREMYQADPNLCDFTSGLQDVVVPNLANIRRVSTPDLSLLRSLTWR
jgi:hypothetical protein